MLFDWTNNVSFEKKKNIIQIFEKSKSISQLFFTSNILRVSLIPFFNPKIPSN